MSGVIRYVSQKGRVVRPVCWDCLSNEVEDYTLDKTFNLICNLCFRYRMEMWRQDWIVQRTRALIKCSSCLDAFTFKRKLGPHKCRMVSIYQCDVCGYQSESLKSREIHFKVVHDTTSHELKTKIKECSEYGNMFINLLQHSDHSILKEFVRLEANKRETPFKLHESPISEKKSSSGSKTSGKGLQETPILKQLVPEANKTSQTGETSFKLDESRISQKETTASENVVRFKICGEGCKEKPTFEIYVQPQVNKTTGETSFKIDEKELIAICSSISQKDTSSRKNSVCSEIGKGFTRAEKSLICELRETPCKLDESPISQKETSSRFNTCGKVLEENPILKQFVGPEASKTSKTGGETVCKLDGSPISQKETSSRGNSVCSKIRKGFPRAEKSVICELCGKLLSTRGVLRIHMRGHTGEKPFKCVTCGLRFAQQNKLKVHLIQHTGERPFGCEICGKRFTRAELLKVHLRSHLGEKPFKCQVCGKLYATKQTLNYHLRTHTGERPFICETCGMGFFHRVVLNVHMNTHMGEKPFICETCGKAFAYPYVLKIHMRIHTGEKPYLCKFCGKTFHNLGNLDGHEKIHTGEKPFICKVCGKAFYSTQKLSYHIKTHTGEKPYSCKICGKSFARTHHLKDHIKTH